MERWDLIVYVEAWLQRVPQNPGPGRAGSADQCRWKAHSAHRGHVDPAGQ